MRATPPLKPLGGRQTARLVLRAAHELCISKFHAVVLRDDAD